MTSHLRAEAIAECPFSIAIEYAVKFLQRDAVHPDTFVVRLPLSTFVPAVHGEFRHRVGLIFGVHYDVADGARGHDEIHFAWQARSRWLPDLKGCLSLSIATYNSTRIVLAGSYQLPLGTFGTIFDALIGGRIAAATAHDFVRRVKDFLETEERAFRTAHRLAQ